MELNENENEVEEIMQEDSIQDDDYDMQAVETKPQKKSFDELDKSMVREERQVFRSFFFKGYNDYDIFVRIWDNIASPKAVILLAHGMVEHGLRYDDFARYLNGRGYILVVPDCRGHGKTAGSPDMVSVYDGDMFGDIVRDNMKLADQLLNTYKVPLVAMGHSFGSFITQAFIQNYHKHSGVILMGSACFKGRLDAKMGKLVARFTKAFCGKDAKAKMIYNMTFGAYGKGKEDGNWLTHDKDKFKEYQLDPYCGAVCTAEFYLSFFGSINKLYRNAGLNAIDKELPMLITSGTEDPVGGKNHKLVDKLAQLYTAIGVKKVDYKLWTNGYHEILNETFRDDVYEYIGDWLDKSIIKE